MDLWQRFDVPENLSGYMQAYLNWQNKHPMEFSHIEIPMVHEEKYFAGTPDRISTTGEVIDIKSGLKEPSHLIQSAGYMMLKPDLIKKRSCLYLHEDGTFEYIVHDDSADLRVFDAALYIYQWKQKAKEKKKK